MKFCLYFILSLTFYANVLFAQREERYEKDENQEQQEYDKEFTYGLNWNTNGTFLGGVNFKFAWQHKKIQTQYHLISLEIVSVVNSRELLVGSSYGSYINEKSGSLFVIRPSFGREIVIFNKAQEEGVQVTWINAGGLSLGYKKPYYIIYLEQADNIKTPYVDETEISVKPYLESTDAGRILGNNGFFSGFDEMVNYTGVHFKTSLNFEYGKFRNSVAGLEVGAMFELMPKKIILVYNAQNQQFFPSLFVNLYLGIR